MPLFMTDKNRDRNFSAAPPESGAPASGGRPFPTVGDLLAMLGIVLGLQIVAGVLAAGFFADTPLADMEPARRGAFMAATYVASMLPAFLAVLWYRRARGGRGPIGRFSRRGIDPVLLAWAFVFMVSACVVCEPLFALLPEPRGVDMGRGVWALLSVVVAAPVLEELLCRGVVLESMRSRYGVAAAWFGSSLFFGVLHGEPVLVVNAFVVGSILGYVCIVAESLWASMILHAANNAVAYALMVSGREATMLSDMVGSRTLYAVLYAGALAVTLLSARMLWRTLRRFGAGKEKDPDAQ